MLSFSSSIAIFAGKVGLSMPITAYPDDGRSNVENWAFRNLTPRR